MVSKEKRLLKAQERYNAAAEKLSDSRKVATKALDQAMEQELSPLKMDRAVFKTEISKTEAGSQGWDMVQFLVSTNRARQPDHWQKLPLEGNSAGSSWL